MGTELLKTCRGFK